MSYPLLAVDELKGEVLRIVVTDPDDHMQVRYCYEQLNRIKKALRDVEELLHSRGCEWIEEHEEIDLGDGRRLGFGYRYRTTHTDRYGTLELLMDEAGLPEGDLRARVVEVFDEVLSKARGGPWLKSGLESLGINTAPLYLQEKRAGKDGEPVRRLTVKDDRFARNKQ